MKLLIIQPTGDKYGHFGMYTSRLASSLSEKGHNVVVCTNFLNPELFIKAPINFKIIQVNNKKLRFEKYERNKKNNPFMYWYAYFRNSFLITKYAFQLAKSENFDAIYITDAEFLVVTLMLKIYSIWLPPVVMQINASNFSFHEYPGNFYKKMYKGFQALLFRQVVGKEIKAFSILGEWHKERLKKQLKLDNYFSINLIEDATTVYKTPMKKKTARKKLDIKFSGKIFLFLGLLRDDKGLEILAAAIKELKKKRKDFRVIVAGFPFSYKKDQILNMFDLKENNPNTIMFKLDYIKEDDIPYYYFASDCLLLPYNSNYKGSSGPLTKGACTFGLPVIVSNVSEMAKLTKKNELGYIFDLNSPKSLADKMDSFLESSFLERQKFKKNAKALAKKYSWPSIASKYEKLFFRLQAHT